MLENIVKQSQEANKYRKAEDYEKAIPLYKKLWSATNDIFAGTGYLHCLRKTNEIEHAFDLADELMSLDSIIDWTRNEILWLYINNLIKKENASISLRKALGIATKLIDLNPDRIQNDIIVFWILKLSNRYKDWEVLGEWADKINHDELNNKPLIINGKEGWSNKARWYHYKIKSIVFAKKFDLDTYKKHIYETLKSFPKQKKFFARLEAIANMRQEKYKEAEEIYLRLCNSKYVDWWIIHEYAKLKIEIGQKKEALLLMYKAAYERGKLDSKINLFRDISILCQDLDLYREAYMHYLLYKHIKERNNWRVEEDIDNRIIECQQSKSLKLASDYKNIYKSCIAVWRASVSKGSNNSTVKKHKQIGHIKLGRVEQNFGFIKISENESIFCLKSDLPSNTKDGDKVMFDIVPSYDKKKERESLRAINVRVVK